MLKFITINERYLFFFFFLTLFNAISQEKNKGRIIEEFPSVFQNLKFGEFEGTVNGVLFIKNVNNADVILDFQGSKAKLLIEKDEEEVYDVSTKRYVGNTSSGKTKIEYQTYATANGIKIYINEGEFELSFLDGASDTVIDGLDFHYKSEPGYEYLVLQFSKELTLSNWQYLIRTEHTTSPDNSKELMKRIKYIKINPNSTLVFIIKRN